MLRARAAASAAALVALAALAATAGFLIARDDPAPVPPATTTTATTTTIDDDAVAAALAAALVRDLPVALDVGQARCTAAAVVTIVGRGRLEALAEATDPLGSLPDADRAALLRAVVECVGPETAAALLGSSTSTSAPAAFPDAGEEE